MKRSDSLRASDCRKPAVADICLCTTRSVHTDMFHLSWDLDGVHSCRPRTAPSVYGIYMRPESSSHQESGDPREQALQALITYEQARASMRSVLRDMQMASDSDVRMHETLALEAITHLNTIDFLLIRTLGRGVLDSLSSRDRNLCRLALYEARWCEKDPSELNMLYPSLKSDLLDAVSRSARVNLPSVLSEMPLVAEYSLKYSHPSFVVETLLDNLPPPEVKALLDKNNQPRPYYLRANRLREGWEDIISELEGLDVVLAPDPDVTGLFMVKDGIEHLISSEFFEDGRVIIQDKSSLIAVSAMNLEDGACVWDACSAPGMKTELIVEAVGSSGRVVATEYSKSRLDDARNLSIRLGVRNVQWILGDATKPPVRNADKILIDAPCSSTGILAAYPSFKWRLNKDTLFALMAIQNKILDGIITTYADRPGTEIVYATCSILPHEGESQIDSVLSHHNVDLLDPVEPASPGYSGFGCSDRVTRLFPHRHNSSGFFIARLRIGP